MTAARAVESSSQPPRDSIPGNTIPGSRNDSIRSTKGSETGPETQRILELEGENHRLRLLVADLLVKNQRLREDLAKP